MTTTTRHRPIPDPGAELPPPDPADLPARLRCVGRDLIKPNGQPIWLHGVNHGAWNDDADEDCPEIAGMRANALRACFRWWGVWGKGGEPNPDSRDNEGFAFLERAKLQKWTSRLNAAATAGLWTIPFIDSNCGQSGTNEPRDIAYCDTKGTWGAAGHNFYTDESMARVFAGIVWPTAAARLRAIARVGLLEIHPEPAHHRPDSWRPRVAQVQRMMIEGIRSVDSDTPILVGAMPGYSAYRVEDGYLALREAFGGTLPENLVWTCNLLGGYVLDPPHFDDGLRHLTDLREKYEVPVFVQQIGRESDQDRDLTCMRHAVAAMREAQVGYTWWAWKQHGSSPDGLGLNWPDENGNWIQKTDEVALLADDWAQGQPV